MRKASGLIAGPESPPVTFASTGRRVEVSIRSAVKVLMRETASAPLETAARAVGLASPLFGESLTIKGSVVALQIAAVTSATACGSAPKTTPPARILGHETLTSI